MGDWKERLGKLAALAAGDARAFVPALRAFAQECLHGPARAAGRTQELKAILSRIAAGYAAEGVPAGGEAGPAPGREEARAAVHNLLELCRVLGFEFPALEVLRGSRAAWTAGVRAGADPELEQVQAELVAAQGDEKTLLEQTARWAEDKQKLAELDGEVLRLQAAAFREMARATPSEARAGQMRAEVSALEVQRAELAARLASYRDLDHYVRNVSRFSFYTRTRRDYERSLIQLTSEQREAVEAMRPGRDFLVRGGAGTGKTIVLLHALANELTARSQELGLGRRSGVLFLTYTTTLVKYDRYIADTLRQAEAEGVILTADNFFQNRLRLLGERQRVDYGVAARLAEKLNTTGFFSAAELAVEVEEFIFGGLVTRREYVEERIPRRGMRQPLSAGQREAVWAVRDRMVEAMEHDGVLSRNYSRVKLIARLDGGTGSGPEAARLAALRDVDVAFVDESQDLSAADLGALKRMSARGLLMAGDLGQSIYSAGSPYRRAGIDISGRARVLHTSFRTTAAIQEVAEAYRRLSGLEEDEDSAAAAVREGPVPELHIAAGRTELARLVLRKAALFIERLGYDPENLAVLAPTKTDLAAIGDLLGHAGYRWANIRDDEFSFRDPGTIRLSTLHSSKGLDFAVVLLYLPALPPRESYDDATSSLLVRNLIYVAMTRAMDNLNVFTLEGAHDGQAEEPLQDLVRVFREQRRQWEKRLLKPAAPLRPGRQPPEGRSAPG